MEPRFKKKNKVQVLATSYISAKYPSHLSGDGTIKELVPREDWLSELTPEYVVTVEGNDYTIPEYSLVGSK